MVWGMESGSERNTGAGVRAGAEGETERETANSKLQTANCKPEAENRQPQTGSRIFAD